MMVINSTNINKTNYQPLP